MPFDGPMSGRGEDKEYRGSSGGSADIWGTAGSAVGAIGSTLLQRHYSIKDRAHQEAYYHPAAEKARLAEAKIPMAAMFSGGFGGESSVPNAPNVDPTLGTAKGIETFLQNRFQKQQIELLQKQIELLNKELPIKDEELRKTAADADYRTADARIKMQDAGYQTAFDDQSPGKTNRVVTLESQKQQQLAKEWISRNQAALSGWQNEIFSSLKEAGVQVSLEKGKLSLQNLAQDTAKIDQALKSAQIDKIANDIAHSIANQNLLNQQFTINEARVHINNMIRSALVEGNPLDIAWLGIITKLVNPKQ